MKKPSFPTLLCALNAAALIGFAPVVTAQNTWTGAIDNDWNTAGNWSGGLPVNSGSGTVTIDLNGANVTMSAAGGSRNLTVAGNGATAPVLNITQNLTNDFSRVHVGSNTGTENGFGGTINHTAGTFRIGGGSGNRDLKIAQRTSGTIPGGTNSGTYNLGGASESAPTLEVFGTLSVGGRIGETGVLSLSGYGTLTQGFGVDGASLIVNTSNGSGTLNITGGNLTINLANSLVFGNFGAGKSILNATIDSTGFSTIHVGGNVSFGGNSLTRSEFNLSLANFTPTVGSVFTIVSAGGSFGGDQARFGNVANNDILTVDGIDFRANYNTGVGGSTFELTVIPEPSYLPLLGVTLLAVVLFRRRRAA